MLGGGADQAPGAGPGVAPAVSPVVHLVFALLTLSVVVVTGYVGQISLAPLAFLAALMARFNYANSGAMQFTESYAWIPGLEAFYKMGIDGLSLPLVALTAILMPLCIIYSFRIEDRLKEYMVLFMLLAVGMFGNKLGVRDNRIRTAAFAYGVSALASGLVSGFDPVQAIPAAAAHARVVSSAAASAPAMAQPRAAPSASAAPATPTAAITYRKPRTY